VCVSRQVLVQTPTHLLSLKKTTSQSTSTS
jgi:hypothetical protein